MIIDEYKFIMSIVVGYFDLEMVIVEEFVVDLDEVFKILIF